MIFLICVIWSITKYLHFGGCLSYYMFLGLAHNLSFSLCLCWLMRIKTLSLNYSIRQVLLPQGPSRTFIKVAVTRHTFLLCTSFLKTIDLYFAMYFLWLLHVTSVLMCRHNTFIDLTLQFMFINQKWGKKFSHELLQEETMNFLILHYLTHSEHYQRERNNSYSQNCHPARTYVSTHWEGFRASLLSYQGYH